MAAGVERGGLLPDDPGDRHAGYAVLGVTFSSGDVLALRRFPLSSTGGGYTCVWHRAPDGRWTFYSDVAPPEGCTRYFGPAIHECVVAPIRIDWMRPRRFNVAVDGGRTLSWCVALGSTWSTAALNASSRWMPGEWWTNSGMRSLLEIVARGTLHSGRLRLAGLTPSGSRFLANPRKIWIVTGSRARLLEKDLGSVVRGSAQVALGDFWIPRRALFLFGDIYMLNQP